MSVPVGMEFVSTKNQILTMIIIIIDINYSVSDSQSRDLTRCVLIKLA